MKKYIVGGLVGFLALPVSAALLLLISYGVEPFYVLGSMFSAPEYPEESEAYRAQPDHYYTNYKLEAPFMDEDSIVSHNREMGLYREEPVIKFQKSDYQSVCVSHYDNRYMDVAITLTASARKKVLESLQYRSETFETSFANGGFRKRYYLEAGGNRIFWFWVSGAGAANHEAVLQANPSHPDMILKVPLEQLYNFQFYLINDMTDTPPLGCSPDVDPRKMPAWRLVIIPFWAVSEMAREEAKQEN